MLTHLLLYRFVIFNLLATLLVGALGMRGFVIPMFTSDSSYLTYATVALFGVTWLAITKRIVRVSRQINNLKKNRVLHSEPERLGNLERDKAVNKTAWFDKSTEWMVTLGLLGTIVGFAIMLDGKTGKEISDTLVVGMKTAVYTTIVGAVLALWNDVNVRMLRTAMANYYVDLVR